MSPYLRNTTATIADIEEAKIGFFDEVLNVHAVERGDEGTRADAQGADGESKIEDHEGVEVGVEDCFCSVGAFSEWVEGS